MPKNLIFLIHHKASLEPHSSMNWDGSTFMKGVAVVRAKNLEEAMIRFHDFLKKESMQLMELYEAVEWGVEKFDFDLKSEEHVDRFAEKALETGDIYYVGGHSSEALRVDEENSKKTKI